MCGRLRGEDTRLSEWETQEWESQRLESPVNGRPRLERPRELRMIVWEPELGRPSLWVAQRMEFQSRRPRVAVSVCGKPSDLEAN